MKALNNAACRSYPTPKPAADERRIGSAKATEPYEPQDTVDSQAEEKAVAFIGCLFCVLKRRLTAFVRRKLSYELYLKIGDDVIQEVFCVLLRKIRCGNLQWINDVNSKKRNVKKYLRCWVFNAVKRILHEKIRECRRYDHGSGDLAETVRVEHEATATGGGREDLLFTTQEPSPRNAPFTGSEVFSFEKISQMYETEAATARVIVAHLKKWYSTKRHLDA